MESSSYADGEEAASSSDVAHFVSLTSCPVDQAAFFLEATNGKFDQAIEMYYGMVLSRMSLLRVTANFNVTCYDIDTNSAIICCMASCYSLNTL